MDYNCQCNPSENKPEQCSRNKSTLPQSNNCSCSIPQNDRNNCYYLRRLQEAEQSLCNKNLHVAMLQEQMKKFEKLYKQSLDETQNVRYKYGSTTQELNNLKRILKNYEEENLKLLEEKNIIKLNESEKNQNELIILQNEAEKWRTQYEQVLNKINTMEDDTAKMKQILTSKDIELKTQTYKTREDMDGDNSDAYGKLRGQYTDIQKALRMQNEKLELISRRLQGDLKNNANELQNVLNATHGDIIEISIEARRLKELSQNMQEDSANKLLAENIALKAELEQLKKRDLSRHSDISEILICKCDQIPVELLQEENIRLKRDLEEFSLVLHENEKLRALLSNYSNSSKKDAEEKVLMNKNLMETSNSILAYKENKNVKKKVMQQDQETICSNQSKQDEQIEYLRKENLELKAEIENLKSIIKNNSEKENTKLRDEIKLKNEEINKLLEQLNLTTEESNDTITELKKENSKIETEKKTLIQNNDSLNIEIIDKTAQIQKFNGIIEQLEHETVSLKSELQNCNERYQKSMEELFNMNKTIEEQEEKLKNHESETNKLHNELNLLKNNENDLKKENEELKNELGVAKETMKQYKQEFKNKEIENKSLRRTSLELQNSVDSMSVEVENREILYKDELGKANKALNEMTAEYNKVKTEMDNYKNRAEQEIKTLKEENVFLENENSDLRTNLDDATKTIDHYTSLVKNSQSELSVLKSDYMNVKNETEYLQSELDRTTETEKKLKTSEQKLEKAENVIIKLQKQLNDSNNHSKNFEDKYNAYLMKINDLNYLIDKLTKENMDLKTNLNNLVLSLEAKIKAVSSDNSKIIQTTTHLNKTECPICDFSNGSTISDFSSCSYSPLCKQLQTKLDIDELSIKRRYLLNRIDSIDREINKCKIKCSEKQLGIRTSISKSMPNLNDFFEESRALNKTNLHIIYDKEKDNDEMSYLTGSQESKCTYKNFMHKQTQLSNQLTPENSPKEEIFSQDSQESICYKDICSFHQPQLKLSALSSQKSTCSSRHIQSENSCATSTCVDAEILKWRDNFKTIHDIRNEMDQVDKNFLQDNYNELGVGTSNSSSHYDSDVLRGRVKTLKQQIDATTEIEKEVEKLQNDVNIQNSEIVNKIANRLTDTCKELCCMNKEDKRTKLLSELEIVQKALQEKTNEEHQLRRQCNVLCEELSKKGVSIGHVCRRSKSTEDITSGDEVFPLLPQPFIKINIPSKCNPQCCDGLLNTCFINTYSKELNNPAKRNKRVKDTCTCIIKTDNKKKIC